MTAEEIPETIATTLLYLTEIVKSTTVDIANTINKQLTYITDNEYLQGYTNKQEIITGSYSKIDTKIILLKENILTTLKTFNIKTIQTLTTLETISITNPDLINNYTDVLNLILDLSDIVKYYTLLISKEYNLYTLKYIFKRNITRQNITRFVLKKLHSIRRNCNNWDKQYTKTVKKINKLNLENTVTSGTAIPCNCNNWLNGIVENQYKTNQYTTKQDTQIINICNSYYLKPIQKTLKTLKTKKNKPP